jgi:hypothetical protein
MIHCGSVGVPAWQNSDTYFKFSMICNGLWNYIWGFLLRLCLGTGNPYYTNECDRWP